MNLEPEIRCPGCGVKVTRAQRTFGRTAEGGPFVNELILEPCRHSLEGRDADILYAWIKKAFEE